MTDSPGLHPLGKSTPDRRPGDRVVTDRGRLPPDMVHSLEGSGSCPPQKTAPVGRSLLAAWPAALHRGCWPRRIRCSPPRNARATATSSGSRRGHGSRRWTFRQVSPLEDWKISRNWWFFNSLAMHEQK